MLVLIDNYDSFTYNLFQILSELGAKVEVVRNDAATVTEIENLKPQRIVISPGPSRPSKAGISVPIIKHFTGRLPLLGVCLGHQCITDAFGGQIEHAPTVVHGKTSLVEHDGKTLFAGLPNPLKVVRYHSLKVDDYTLPPQLQVSARSQADGVVMAVRHRSEPVEGIQFHPESHAAEGGRELLRNFLKL